MDAPTIHKAAQTALDIQDAVNLTAIIGAWKEARRAVGNPAASSLHPVDVLFVSKVVSLLTVDVSAIGSVTAGDSDVFHTAYEWAQQAARGTL